MALEQSYAFKQLAERGRFGRFDYVDGAIVLEAYTIHYLVELVLGGNELRAFATFIAAAVGVYVLRRFYPEGVGPLLRMALTPRHLSSLASDRILVPYPAAPPRRP